MLKTGIVWQEQTLKIEKSRGCQGSFFVFSIFVPSARRAQGTMLSCIRVSVILAVRVICREVSSP